MVEVKKSLKSVFAHKRKSSKRDRGESDEYEDDQDDQQDGDGSKSRPLPLPRALLVGVFVLISVFFILQRADWACSFLTSSAGSEGLLATKAAGSAVGSGDGRGNGGTQGGTDLPRAVGLNNGLAIPDAGPAAVAGAFIPENWGAADAANADADAPLDPDTIEDQPAEVIDVPFKRNRPATIPKPPMTPIRFVGEVFAPAQQNFDVADLESAVQAKLEAIHDLKFGPSRTVIETDPTAQRIVRETQSMLRQLLTAKYGPGPYYAVIELEFPDSMMRGGLGDAKTSSLVIELAPIAHVPYSVYFFIENIIHKFASGAFHRNAGHVLQAMTHPKDKTTMNLAWQEYSPSFPHAKYTLGYAGRPSSNRAFYISTMDNKRNHGPGSQGSATEADACFGRIVEGVDVVQRMLKQPGKGASGFITSQENFIRITSIQLMPTDYRPSSMLRGGAPAAAAAAADTW